MLLRTRVLVPLGLAALVTMLSGCADDSTPPSTTTAADAPGTGGATTTRGVPAEFTLLADGFGAGEPIPLVHACEPQGGSNEEVVLMWSGAPADAASLALVMDDPDALTPEPFVHWVVVDIDPFAGATDVEGGKGIVGVTTTGDPNYFGPCPPPGEPHNYRFRLFAFESSPTWSDQPTGADVEAAGATALDVAELTGTFQNAG